jgi:trimethylguanosine synthase
MDDTGWFSVTPAAIASQIAERCACGVVVDAFCGVGGNAIAFAATCERVIAIDNCEKRLRLARHNALQCGVADRIEFVLADYTAWARARAGAAGKEAVDVVFLSPPWGESNHLLRWPYADYTGGIEYQSGGGAYPLSAILPIPGDELFTLSAGLTPNIAYFLPRNVDIQEVAALAAHIPHPTADTVDGSERAREWVEIEEEWVGDKLKAVTAYFGSLVSGA